MQHNGSISKDIFVCNIKNVLPSASSLLPCLQFTPALKTKLMATHLLGIRHHGPGSAKNVKAFLEELKPDIVLIEGPPEADAILSWTDDEELKPPVAILCYQPEDPQSSVFYPFV